LIDQVFIPAIKKTIRQNEIGSGNPYRLSFARHGKSGASFGFMQGDTNMNGMARATLKEVLAAAGIDPAAADQIMNALSRPLPNGDPLSPEQSSTVDHALSSAGGRPFVDNMDDELLGVVLSGVDSCVAAATSRGITLLPIIYLYIAPWINMSGPPTLLIAWLKGSSIYGVVPPAPPDLTEQDVQAYLQAMPYFQTYPKNFNHYKECVATGAKLLP
jgi:hypothetical protein